MTHTEPELISQRVRFHNDLDARFGIERHQEIPDWHLDDLCHEFDYNKNHRAGEMHRVASVPTVVVDEWARAGFDIHTETPEAILRRLRLGGLDRFITSPKIG